MSTKLALSSSSFTSILGPTESTQNMFLVRTRQPVISANMNGKNTAREVDEAANAPRVDCMHRIDGFTGKCLSCGVQLSGLGLRQWCLGYATVILVYIIILIWVIWQECRSHHDWLKNKGRKSHEHDPNQLGFHQRHAGETHPSHWTTLRITVALWFFHDLQEVQKKKDLTGLEASSGLPQPSHINIKHKNGNSETHSRHINSSSALRS